jgi:molybdopterin synthase catalytic subunit
MTATDLPGGDYVEVSAAPLVPEAVLPLVQSPAAGAIALFLGTVRDHSAGRPAVTRLEYEAYPGVVEDTIRTLIDAARDRWSLERVAVAHRTGILGVGEVSVIVAVAAGHRGEAFEAARFLIDEVKAHAPIWKKEHWEGGAEWVQGA